MNESEEGGTDGAPLFCQLLTPKILKDFFTVVGEIEPKHQIRLISCGFDHCLAVTDPPSG